MNKKEYRTIDKSEWMRGEWDSEPDKIQWTDESTGMPCLIVRGPSGALCGYVGVTDSHPFYEKGYSAAAVDIDGGIEVHGGLTYSDKCQPGEDESKGICHAPTPGEPDDVWWFGFDCYHCFDIGPRRLKQNIKDGFHDPASEYRSVRYVELQVAKLAKQLKEQS